MPPLSTLMPMDNLLQFGLHFAAAAAAVVLFALLWLWATPFKEIALIRAGNSAAAVSFGGALIGFALPVAGVVRASTSIWEVVPWSVLALLAQLAGLLIAARLLHGVTRHIESNEMASGIFMASVAVTIGLLNAACLGG